MLSGFATGAVGWFFNPTCFAAGTEVVTGVEYEEEEGIVREVTARRLSQMGKEKRAAILEKARLKIIRYMTCAIELLKAGDWVLTRDESDAEGELILRQIEEKFERTAYNLLFLTIRSSSGQTQTLTTTNEHPVYVEGLGWIVAQDLEPGQEVMEPDGSKSTVIATRHERRLEGITVYNFRVNECHTYFVREQASEAEPVWVHNANYGNNPFLKGKSPIPGTRSTGVARAKSLEVALVRATGKGTIQGGWTAAEVAFIKRSGRLPNGIVGHHINSVVPFSKWAGDPRNIRLVRGRAGNLQAHGGAFQNITRGPLIDRAAMLP
jgi:hypothetical protein